MQSWHDEFTYMKKTVDWGVLTYTMHPYVIGRGYRMLALEDLVDKLAQDGAVFMTMEQAAEEAKAEVVRLGSSGACGRVRFPATAMQWFGAQSCVVARQNWRDLRVKRREFLASARRCSALSPRGQCRHGSQGKPATDRRSGARECPIPRPS